MPQPQSSPTKIVREWWGVALVFAGMIGGFAWLERNYAKKELLDAYATATALTEQYQEIEKQFAKIDALTKATNQNRCYLLYAIDEQRSGLRESTYNERVEKLDSDFLSLSLTQQADRRGNYDTDKGFSAHEACRNRRAKECQIREKEACIRGIREHYERDVCALRNYNDEC